MTLNTVRTYLANLHGKLGGDGRPVAGTGGTAVNCGGAY